MYAHSHVLINFGTEWSGCHGGPVHGAYSLVPQTKQSNREDDLCNLSTFV